MSTMLRSVFGKPFMGRLLATAVCLAPTLASFARADFAPVIPPSTIGLHGGPPLSPPSTIDLHGDSRPPVPEPLPAPVPPPAPPPGPVPAPVPAPPAPRPDDCASRYAAIAYSPCTGQAAYSHDCRSQEEAERMALGCCKHEDARVVVWVKDGFCTLFVGDDRTEEFAWGWGVTKEAAENAAKQACEQKGWCGHVVCTVSSRQ